MNSEQFSEYIANPLTTGSGTVSMLEELTRRYPYCQSGQLLYTYNLFREDDPQYPAQLKKAAAYAGDRRVLRGLIGLGKTTLESAPRTAGVQEFRVNPAAQKEVDPVEPCPSSDKPGEEGAVPFAISEIHGDADGVVEEMAPGTGRGLVVTWELAENRELDEMLGHPAPHDTGDRMTQQELLAIVRRRLAEISAVKNQEIAPAEMTGSPGSSSKMALIDKFIREEPRISKPKTAFFSPAESASRSNIDEEEIVSETLAQLYAKQGNIQKAIHVYEKLSLLNQEKSRYFAAQIENLGS